MKKAGLYVDLDDEQRVASTPAAATRDQASEQLGFARDLMRTLLINLPDDETARSRAGEE